MVENENATKVLDITTIVLKISTCSTIEINTGHFLISLSINLISRDQIWAIAFLFRDFYTIVSRATVFLETRTFSAKASNAVRVDK